MIHKDSCEGRVPGGTRPGARRGGGVAALFGCGGSSGSRSGHAVAQIDAAEHSGVIGLGIGPGRAHELRPGRLGQRVVTGQVQGVALFGGLAGLFGQGKDALHFAGPHFIRRDIGTGHGHHAGEHDQLTAQHGLAGSMVDTAAHGTGVLHVVLLCYAVALARVIQRRALAPTSMRTLVSKPSVSKLSRLSM